ncbi:RNA polymerase sigma factor RpoH [Alphaproteobacteria bacterium]|nr:RNA polymerase sigma factor RpoH [Alphaproteobacteria bacterium]
MSKKEEHTPSARNPAPPPASPDSMSSYFQEIKNYPILEPDEEYELATQWYQNQDEKAAKKLITSHLRLVAKIAAGYRGYGLPVADLIAEGNIGVLNAMKKFDPEKGFRFSTYAMWWIRASIQEYVLRTWSLVRMGTTGAQKKLFFNLKRMKKEISELEDEFQGMTDKDIKEIAEKLDVKETDVREMEGRMDRNDASLNMKTSQEESGGEWQDWIESTDPTQEESLIEADTFLKKKEVLEKCLQYLTPREVTVLKARRLKEPPDTLDIIAKEVGLSKERVRQIEGVAFSKLRNVMRKEFLKKGWTDQEW